MGSFNKTELALPKNFECLELFLLSHRSERHRKPIHTWHFWGRGSAQHEFPGFIPDSDPLPAGKEM